MAMLCCSITSYQLVTAQVTASTSKIRIPTCDEVGLCNKGEKRVIIDESNALNSFSLSRAMADGCRVKKKAKRHTSLVCPAGAIVPNGRTERMFRITDIKSNTQILASGLQQTGITGTGVIVAVLDTGVDTTHPELQNVIMQIANFTTESGSDLVGHGTHVSGIIAGQGIQGIQDGSTVNRVVGVSPGAKIIVGKVCNSQGWCAENDIGAGIEWAVSQKARVINLSLGGGSFLGTCDTDAMAQDVNWAVDQGVTVVVAAGNAGQSGEGIATPGCASKVITVGAVDGTDVRTAWSQFGSALDIVAPGVNILSSLPCSIAGTCPNAGYGWWSGTSMATPAVTGVVALMLQTNPTLAPVTVLSLLRSSAVDLGTKGFDTSYGYGRVDAAAAVFSAGHIPSSSSLSSISSFSSSLSSSSTATTSSATSRSSMRSSSSISSWTSSSFSSSLSSSLRSSENSSARDCIPSDWHCEDQGECTNVGQMVRCELANMRCNRPELVRPPLVRICFPHSNAGERDEMHGSGDVHSERSRESEHFNVPPPPRSPEAGNAEKPRQDQRDSGGLWEWLKKKL